TVGLGLRSLAQLCQLAVTHKTDRVVVRTVNYSRRDQFAGKQYCVFFDQMVQELGRERFLVSEGRIVTDEYARNVPNRVDFYDDVVELLVPLYRRALRRRVRQAVQRTEPAAQRISPHAAPGWAPLAQQFTASYHAWRLIYRLLKPRAVIVTIG